MVDRNGKQIMDCSKETTGKIYFRADGNDVIATGHIMRCLSIAANVRRFGFEVTFVLADESPRHLIEGRGFNADILGTTWDDLDNEINVMCSYINEHNVRVLVVDSYYVTEKYLRNLSENTNVVYIDDLFAFAYPVDTIINYGVFANVERYNELYKGKATPRYLVGGSYVPLREEFSGIEHDINAEIRRVLITTGGTDRLNVAGNLLKELMHEEELVSIEYNVIVGCFNNNKDMLKAMADESGGRIVLHENVNNMSDYMKKCDAAISASGSTLYELCACGMPTVCFEIASNQEGAERWENEGYMLYSGNAAKDLDSCINSCISKLIWLNNHYQERMEMSSRMQKLVDGKGAERLAEYIINTEKVN